MHEGTIVLKQKGRDIDPAYLKLAMDGHNTFGCATYSVDETGKDVLQTSSLAEAISIEAMTDMQETFKEHQVLCYFGKHDPVIDADLQPYGILVDDKDNPIMIAMVTGDYDKPDESAHSGAFHFVNTWLIPHVQKLDRLLEGKIDRVIGELEDPVTKRDVEGKSGERGVVALLTNTDACLLMAKTDTSAEFSWGWVSNHFGFGQEIKKEETKNEQIKAKLGGMLGMTKNKPSVPQVASVTPIKPTATKHAESAFGKIDALAAKTDTAVPVVKQLFMAPPANHRQGKNAARNWYTAHHGAVPQLWREFPAVLILPKKIPDLIKGYGKDKIMSTDELAPLRPFLEVGVLPITTKAADEPAPAVKEPDQKPATEPVIQPAKKEEEPLKTDAPTVTDLTHAIIPHYEKLQFRKEVIPRVKAAIQAGKEIMDPKAILALSEPSPRFSQQTGLQIEELMRWPEEERLSICQGLPATANAIISELLYLYSGALVEMEQLTAPKTEKSANTNLKSAVSGKK